MLSEGWELGIVRERQARDARIAAANPRHAKRILGRPLARPPAITAPVVLAKAPKESGKRIVVAKYPWATLSIGEYFDVPMEDNTRKCMAQQARNAWGRHKRRFGVALATNRAGHGVIRVTRMT